jgi:3-phenylpropionate/trans-cinnamate dioxygenase ferredoxin reductase subunit
VADGVVVDSSLRTSHPDIYAVGDVAKATATVQGQQAPLGEVSFVQGGAAVAAQTVQHRPVTYTDLPGFAGDIPGLTIQVTGTAVPATYDQVVFRGSVADRAFTAFWLSRGRVMAGMTANTPSAAPQFQALIRSGKTVDTQRLTDTSTTLSDALA